MTECLNSGKTENKRIKKEENRKDSRASVRHHDDLSGLYIQMNEGWIVIGDSIFS